jgi:hypothetical protein
LAESKASFRQLTDDGQVHDLTSVNPVKVPIFRMMGLKILDRQVSPSFALSRDLNMAMNIHPAMILGFDVIRHFNWAFDLRRAKWGVF